MRGKLYAARISIRFVTSVILALILCEAGIRLFGLGGMMEFEPSTAWGYLMRPEQRVYVYGHPVIINSDGIRGPKLSSATIPDHTRIVFLGDSIAYGGGRIREEALFVRRIEAMLREQGVPSEVVNLSAPGWSPQNWIGFVRRRGLFGADAVVAVIPEVDLGRPFSTMAMHGLRENAPPLRLGWFFLKLKYTLWAPARDAWKDVNRDVEARKNLVAVKELLRRAKHLDILALVVLVPSFPQSADQQKYWAPYERLSVPTVDLRKVLDEPEHFLDGVHLTPAGHEKAAEEIAVALLGASERVRQAAR